MIFCLESTMACMSVWSFFSSSSTDINLKHKIGIYIFMLQMLLKCLTELECNTLNTIRSLSRIPKVWKSSFSTLVTSNGSHLIRFKPTMFSFLDGIFNHKGTPPQTNLHLVMMLFIWCSFSSCCLRNRSSVSSSRAWYSRSIFWVWSSWLFMWDSYSSSFLAEIRSFSCRTAISCWYWGGERENEEL